MAPSSACAQPPEPESTPHHSSIYFSTDSLRGCQLPTSRDDRQLDEVKPAYIPFIFERKIGCSVAVALAVAIAASTPLLYPRDDPPDLPEFDHLLGRLYWALPDWI